MVSVLGLKYGTVRLVDHDARWREAFLTERALLIEALDGLRCVVEHIGSTAVPGLTAKPILDIAVGIPDSADVPASIARLQHLGYEYRGDAGADGGHVLVRANGDVRTHHVHVVELEGKQWRAYLAFRDLLRNDPLARQMYAAAKQELALRFADDRKSYTKAKDELVGRLLPPTTGAQPSR
ncbi:MAG: GrpB family protein [Longimicrobiales bacterium]